MTVRIGDTSFAAEVAERAHLERCSQCLTCAATCPVGFALDYAPNQLVRMAQLGLKERLLGSSAIWLCASCETCTARCPWGVDIVGMMDALRQMALEHGHRPEKSIAAFHAAFIESVRRGGRVHEPSLMVRYIFSGTFRGRDLIGNIRLGLKMLARGRLPLFPHRPKGWKQVAGIVRKGGAQE